MPFGSVARVGGVSAARAKGAADKEKRPASRTSRFDKRFKRFLREFPFKDGKGNRSARLYDRQGEDTIVTGGRLWKIEDVTTHPGEMLLQEFLIPLAISQNQLAIDIRGPAIRVPAIRIRQILKGNRSITSDTALRLSRYFGNSPEFWPNLQQMYDLSKARQELASRIHEEVRPLRRTA
jgi:addiction module HigA family antidote